MTGRRVSSRWVH